MPSKNSRKVYLTNGVYHVYNRGVDKCEIFREEGDFFKLLYLLARCRKFGIEIYCYCLMPNHYHLLLFQSGGECIKRFQKSVFISYSMYFNRKYSRVGPLFQDRYKAVVIKTEDQFKHVSRYIHLNPVELPAGADSYRFSSYPDYLSGSVESAGFVNKERILGMFGGAEKYKRFVEGRISRQGQALAEGQAFPEGLDL